jgi:LemA protein
MKRITVTSTLITLSVISFIILILTGKNCTVCFAPQTIMIKLMLAGLVFICGGIYFTWKYLRIERMIFGIELLPLLDTNEAVKDLPFSCEGNIVPLNESVLTSPYTQTPCVYYHSVLEKYVQQGKRKTWVIAENQTQSIPFYIADDRGKLLINPLGVDHDLSSYAFPSYIKTDNSYSRISEIDPETVIKHAEDKEAKTILGFIPSSTRIRRSEFVLRPGTQIFAYGYVSKTNDDLVLQEFTNHPLLISRKTKEAFIQDFYKGGNLVYIVHVLVSLGFTAFLSAANYFLALNQYIFYPLLIIGNITIIGSVVFTIYNRIITYKQRALETLSNIDIELKRRNELIPSLLSVISKYTEYEKDLFEQIASTRVQTMQSVETDEKRLHLKPLLIGLSEKYPQLASHRQYRELMIELIDTEERIAYSRSAYNKNIAKFNIVISQFPQNLFAEILHMKPMEFITIS